MGKIVLCLTTVIKYLPLIIFVILTGVPLGKLGLNIFNDVLSNSLSKELSAFLSNISANPLLEYTILIFSSFLVYLLFF